MDEPLDLDERCGEFFTLRDLIECGETWHLLHDNGRGIANLPAAAETISAMRALCRVVLDPVARALGAPALTYGFASPALTKQIPGRIAPALDQHAGSEVGRTGRLVCARRGFAVDFNVPGVPTHELEDWVTRNTAFDRFYSYGEGRPVHVSVGPDTAGVVVHMIPGPQGRRVPRVVRRG